MLINLAPAGDPSSGSRTMRVVSDADDVISAARERGAALAQHDEARLRVLLHPGFVWTSRRGEWFDREAYLDSNLRGGITWHDQELRDPEVRVVADTAV